MQMFYLYMVIISGPIYLVMQNPVLPYKNNKTDITYYISTHHYHTVPLVSFHQTAADHISFVDSSISYVRNYSREL